MFNMQDERCRCDRLERIPDMIRQLGFHNPAVARALQEYAVGNIITKTECLCHIIILLDKDWNAEQQRIFKILEITWPTFPPEAFQEHGGPLKHGGTP